MAEGYVCVRVRMMFPQILPDRGPPRTSVPRPVSGELNFVALQRVSSDTVHTQFENSEAILPIWRVKSQLD